MKIGRREFLKTTALGASGMALGMTPFQIRTKSDIDRLYDRSIVIDTLCVGHDWDKEELDAVDKSGYTGIQTSLANRTWDSALESIAEWNDRIDANPEVFLKATKASHFRQAKKEDKVAVLYGDGAGVNLNRIIGSPQLNMLDPFLLLDEFGVAAVKRINKLGIIVDLSHCGKQTSYNGIKFSDPPACFTHTMCEALYPGHPRAKTNDQLLHVAGKGGMIGIAALGYFVGPDPGGKTTIETYLDHIDHAVKLVGLDHVGFCTNFQTHGIKAWAEKET